jgi:hypothetical protein
VRHPFLQQPNILTLTERMGHASVRPTKPQLTEAAISFDCDTSEELSRRSTAALRRVSYRKCSLANNSEGSFVLLPINLLIRLTKLV